MSTLEFQKSTESAVHSIGTPCDRLQRPPQPAARQLGPRLGRRAAVLPPHVAAADAAVAADREQQRRWPPTERLMREPPRHRVTQLALAAAAGAPVIRLD